MPVFATLQMWRVDGRGRVYAHMLDTVKIYNPCGSAASVVHTGAIEERCVDNHARVCDSTNVARRRQRPCLRSYAHTLYVTTMVPSMVTLHQARAALLQAPYLQHPS